MKKLLLLIMALCMMCFSACNTGGASESSGNDFTGNSSISNESDSSNAVDGSGDSGSDIPDDSSSDIPDDSSSDIPDDSSGGDSSQKEVYTITFQQDGVEDIVKTVEEGEALTDIPEPNQVVGYNVEWSVTDFSSITDHMTVTVVATAKKYTITYTLGTRANDSMAQLANKEQQVEYDATYELETPTCEGYIFVGWMIEGLTTVLEDGNWAIDDDVTLVAQWTVDPSSNRDHTGRY